MRPLPLVVVALAAAAVVSTVGQPASGARSACRKTYVASYAFSADSRWIAVQPQRDCDALPSLVLMRPDGSGRRLLARAVVGAVWAPKGERIAFESANGGVVSLTLATPKSKSIRRIANATAFAWSPGGTQVAARRTASEDIAVTALTGPVRSVAQAPLGTFRQGHALQWSPDGRSILFTEAGSGTVLSIRVVGRDGQGEHEIARGRSPSWSPDGSRILYDAGSPGQPTWTTVGPDGSDPRSVGPQGLCTQASWSPHGRWATFVACTNGTPGVAPETWVDLPLGGRVVDLGTGNPAWSPTAARLALARTAAVTLVNPDGSGRVNLSLGGVVAWAPSGRTLVVSGKRLYLVPSSGRGARPLPAGSRPVWSPNGRWIAVTRGRSCGQNLDLLRVSGRRIRPVLRCE